MSNRFDRQYPAPGASVLTCVQPVMAQLDWSVQTQTPADADAGCVTFNWPEADGKVRMTDKAGALAIDLPLAVPAAIVHQPWSWNWLIGNPAGELSTRSAVQAIEMHLPERQFLPFGPAWLRGWLAAFLLSMLVSALVYKHRRGIA